MSNKALAVVAVVLLAVLTSVASYGLLYRPLKADAEAKQALLKQQEDEAIKVRRAIRKTLENDADRAAREQLDSDWSAINKACFDACQNDAPYYHALNRQHVAELELVRDLEDAGEHDEEIYKQVKDLRKTNGFTLPVAR